MDWNADQRNRFRRYIKRWYGRHARVLPWRETHDPYAIWISEIMLQQTTVSAVIPYYQRFTQRFPSVRELAAADPDDVLQLWEGLGYYSRARNIHKTALILHQRYQDRFPQNVKELMALPGIGRYTAGAIASFAFDQRAPIVEANTRRLYSRLLGCLQDLSAKSAQQLLWEFAEMILPHKSPGQFNQALMELGSQICTPIKPACPSCPVKSCCQAFREEKQHLIPKPKARPGVTVLTEACIAIRKSGRYLLRKRQPEERWSGLWDFPRFSFPQGFENHNRVVLPNRLIQILSQEFNLQTGIQIHDWQFLTEFQHSITRYKINLFCYRAEYKAGKLHKNAGLRWFSKTELANTAMSAPGRKIANRLTNAS